MPEMPKVEIVQGDLFVNLGEHRLIVDPKQIKVKTTIVIRDRMVEVKTKHSPYAKVPRKPEETGEDWTERFLEYLGKSSIRRKNEKEEDYLKRVLSPAAFDENLEYYKAILKAIAEQFGQGEKVTDASFNEAVLEEVLNFIVKVLKRCKYPTEEFEI